MDYAENFINPEHWMMICFFHKNKKQYIVWNTYYYGAWATGSMTSSSTRKPFIVDDLARFISLHYDFYDRFIGDTPDEALDKLIVDMLGEEENLNSIRLRADIAGTY